MKIFPSEIINIILEFIRYNYKKKNISYFFLKKMFLQHTNLYLINKNIIYLQYRKNIYQLYNLLVKYPAYQYDYEISCQENPDIYHPNPILYDMIFTNCIELYSKNTYDFYKFRWKPILNKKNLMNDILSIIHLLPDTIESSYAKVSKYENTNPLFAACINYHISYDILEILINHGSTIYPFIDSYRCVIEEKEKFRFNFVDKLLNSN